MLPRPWLRRASCHSRATGSCRLVGLAAPRTRRTLTIIRVGEDEVVPFAQNGATLCRRCRLPELLLCRFGARDGGLEVRELAVGHTAEDGGGRGFWRLAVSARQRRPTEDVELL